MTRDLGPVASAFFALATVLMLLAHSPASAGAAANSWPHEIVNGFATPDGSGFWLTYADGTVETHGSAQHLGDVSSLPLAGPVVGGAAHPSGNGYWLVAQDGGIFAFGSTTFFGSMGGESLNQPVFSMSPTTTGLGYWLVAFDGGIFSFGDASFHGSTGDLPLNQPIAGMTTSAAGNGYQLVARDGGVFAFGDFTFRGSLPGLGLNLDDVIGVAQTPSGSGYWVARDGGEVYAFGDAVDFGDHAASAEDPIAAIFSNPTKQGYRLVTQSGATVPFGAAPSASKTPATPSAPPPTQTPTPTTTAVAPSTPTRVSLAHLLTWPSLTANWTPPGSSPALISAYEVQSRLSDGPWSPSQLISSPPVDLPLNSPGAEYEVRVRSVAASGQVSEWASSSGRVYTPSCTVSYSSFVSLILPYGSAFFSVELQADSEGTQPPWLVRFTSTGTMSGFDPPITDTTSTVDSWFGGAVRFSPLPDITDAGWIPLPEVGFIVSYATEVWIGAPLTRRSTAGQPDCTTSGTLLYSP